MSDQKSARATYEAETSAFVSLGLAPGNWAALAPAPLLLRTDLRRPLPKEFPLLRALADLIPGTAGKPGDAEGFWSRCLPAMSTDVLALLGWHLAHGVERELREQYFLLLDQTAQKLLRTPSPTQPLDVSSRVREALEASLGHTAFARHLSPVSVEPPSQAEIGKLFLDDQWKQLPIEEGLRVIARGLATLPVAERRRMLESFWKMLRQCATTIPQLANACVDELRKLAEEILRGSPKSIASELEIPDVSGIPVTDNKPHEPPPPTVAFAPLPVVPTAPPAEPTSPPVVATPTPKPPTRHMLQVITPSDIVPLTLAQAMEHANATTVAQVRDWLANTENGSRFLFDDCRKDCSEVAIVSDPAAVPQSLWIIGDVHADVLALANIIENADRVAKQEGVEPHFLFLGDFVDRGRHDHETLLLLFGLVMRNPSRVCIIPGNHDIDLRWGEKARKFGVTIQPAEYCERLNGISESELPADREQIELAKLMIEFWKTRPKAVFLPDGTMFTHGGFPHTDLHDSLKARVDLGSKKCLDDFLWARLSESVKKRPNRGNRGHEFGWKDFSQFCKVASEQLAIPVQRLIRGHDHVAPRWHLPSDYVEHPVLTINAMGWRLDGEPEPTDGPHPYPVAARHYPNQLPLIVRLRLDPVEVDRGLGKEPRPASSGTEELIGDVAANVLTRIQATEVSPPAPESPTPSAPEPPAPERGG
ncbi:MAG: metallophosphoesterase [Planctomycetes bacterium]|nr:metallophosphoesterase [Planctomycetota bacterium]